MTGRAARNIVVVALLSFVGSALASSLLGVPTPAVPDEFSYVLAADTFARGRLTNPPHPMWMHFETFHINQQPTYASKYPPAQGLVLAAGRVLGGHFVVGVWLGSALMCGAVTWLLQGWLPRRWALVGGLLLAIRFGIVGDWAQFYWGGAVAATGGALVYGALPRLIRRPRASLAVVMGIGLIVLANSRPWEGLLACLPAAAVLLVWMIRRGGPQRSVVLARVVLPTATVLVVGAVAMGVYNHAVTGRVARLPYQVHEAQYGVAPVFIWQPLREPPSHRHESLRYAQTERFPNVYRKLRTPSGYLRNIVLVTGAWWWEFCGPVLTIPLLAVVPIVLRKPRPALAALVVGMLFVGTAVTTYYGSHYMAPMTGLVVYLSVEGIRRVRTCAMWPRSWSRWIVVAVLALVVVEQVPEAIDHWSRYHDDDLWWRMRCRITERLEDEGGRHLIIVEQEPGTHHTSWVYNSAEIDEQAVVWAHDMGSRNEALLDYYGDRSVWRLRLLSSNIEFERDRRGLGDR